MAHGETRDITGARMAAPAPQLHQEATVPEVLAYACDDAATQLHRATITIPEPGPHDV